VDAATIIPSTDKGVSARDPAWLAVQRYAALPSSQFRGHLSRRHARKNPYLHGGSRLSAVSVAVDVGGSNGSLVQALMQGNPRLTGIVLDRPNVVPGAILEAGKAGLADRFTAVGGDFFTEVPAANLYLLKLILSDWDDESCRTILRNCPSSARPGARAVVMETVVGEIGKPDFGALLDIHMLCVTEGQERDLNEFDALFAASGWRRVAIHQTRTPFAILELKAT